MGTRTYNSARKRKYFRFALLCLIPGFGILVGIYLLFFAIFEFKSLKLVMTISTYMLVSCGLFAIFGKYLDYDMKYGVTNGAARALWVPDDLDAIVVRLAKYKNIYGNYPDSLPELQVLGSISIKDPLLTRNSKAHKSLYYYYQKKDTTYILFSSGIDAIPHTVDDIYPRRPNSVQ
jgi:hypothetical protein